MERTNYKFYDGFNHLNEQLSQSDIYQLRSRVMQLEHSMHPVLRNEDAFTEGNNVRSSNQAFGYLRSFQINRNPLFTGKTNEEMQEEHKNNPVLRNEDAFIEVGNGINRGKARQISGAHQKILIEAFQKLTQTPTPDQVNHMSKRLNLEEIAIVKFFDLMKAITRNN